MHLVEYGNRTYRAWGNIELPKYLLKPHKVCATNIVISNLPNPPCQRGISYSRFRNYLYTRIVTRTVKVLGTG